MGVLSMGKLNRRKILKGISGAAAIEFGSISAKAAKEDSPPEHANNEASLPDLSLRQRTHIPDTAEVKMIKNGKTILDRAVSIDPIVEQKAPNDKTLQLPNARGKVAIVIDTKEHGAINHNFSLPAGGMPEFRGKVVEINGENISIRTQVI